MGCGSSSQVTTENTQLQSITENNKPDNKEPNNKEPDNQSPTIGEQFITVIECIETDTISNRGNGSGDYRDLIAASENVLDTETNDIPDADEMDSWNLKITIIPEETDGRQSETSLTVSSHGDQQPTLLTVSSHGDQQPTLLTVSSHGNGNGNGNSNGNEVQPNIDVQSTVVQPEPVVNTEVQPNIDVQPLPRRVELPPLNLSVIPAQQFGSSLYDMIGANVLRKLNPLPEIPLTRSVSLPPSQAESDNRIILKPNHSVSPVKRTINQVGVQLNRRPRQSQRRRPNRQPRQVLKNNRRRR